MQVSAATWQALAGKSRSGSGLTLLGTVPGRHFPCPRPGTVYPWSGEAAEAEVDFEIRDRVDNA